MNELDRQIAYLQREVNALRAEWDAGNYRVRTPLEGASGRLDALMFKRHHQDDPQDA